MANKITNREMINGLMVGTISPSSTDAQIWFIHQLELLDKKASSKKATKTQEENVGIKSTILEVLGTISSGTVTDIQNSNDDLKVLSNQKISALLRQLVEAGEVVKTTDKKKSYFSLA